MSRIQNTIMKLTGENTNDEAEVGKIVGISVGMVGILVGFSVGDIDGISVGKLVGGVGD